MRGYMLSLTIVLELVTMEHLFLPRLYFLRLSQVEGLCMFISRVKYANEFRL